MKADNKKTLEVCSKNHQRFFERPTEDLE